MSAQFIFIAIAAANGFTAVALGAFGAHALKSRLSEAMLHAWETAVQYHFYHLLALFGVALAIQFCGSSKALLVAGALFVVGILMFCGSLYGLALGGPKILGPITPLGGLCFMAGWVSLFVAGFAALADRTGSI